MIGEKIKQLRLKNKMTQKALADKLFVTAQAVSRWENGEVEPSISTITMLARIFEISTDELLGVEENKNEVDPEQNEEKEADKREELRFPIARCNECYQDIYETTDIIKIRSGEDRGIKCKKCADRILKERKADFENSITEKRIRMAEARRKNALTILISLTSLALAFAMLISITGKSIRVFGILMLLYFILVYPVLSWIYCYILRNTFIGRIVYSIANFWKNLFKNKLEEGTAVYFFIVTVPSWLFGIISFPTAVLVYVLLAPLIFPYAIYKSIRYFDEIYLGGEFWDKNKIYMDQERKMFERDPMTLLDDDFLELIYMDINDYSFLS